MRDQAVVVIGDILLDRSRHVDFSRWSPEDENCPVGVDEREEFALGGAGNVARWLAGLSHRFGVRLHGHHSRSDPNSATLWKLARAASVTLEPELSRSSGRITTKERVYVHRPSDRICQQAARIDNDTLIEIVPQEIGAVLGSLRFLIGRKRACQAPLPVLVVADYGKGVFGGGDGPDFIRQLGTFVETEGLLTIVNSKFPKMWAKFPADVLVCNEAEFDAAWPGSAPARCAAMHLIVTRGSRGVSAFSTVGSGCGGMRVKVNTVNRPTQAADVYDVTGAGDAFLAGLTASLIDGGHPHGHSMEISQLEGAVDFGQICAARCCAQLGVGNPERIEISAKV